MLFKCLGCRISGCRVVLGGFERAGLRVLGFGVSV